MDLYPNPANNIVNLSIENDIDGIYEISIVDMTGKTVYQEAFVKNSTSFIQSVDVRQLPTAQYLMTLTKGEAMQVQSFVKFNP